jgi:hypothetical protein
LGSWTPRRPSAKIHDQLFANDAAPTRANRQRISLNWLAPVTVCALSMLVMFGEHSRSPARLGETDTNLFFASITMNSVTSFNSATSLKPAYALSKADLNLEQNVWRIATFESTNYGQSHSSMGSLPSEKTNSLTH